MISTAIVSGANGLLGRALVSALADMNIRVIALGRALQIHHQLRPLLDQGAVIYLPVSASVAAGLEIDRIFATVSATHSGPEVFFNLAWSGTSRLADGSLADQIQNVSLGCAYVQLAKQSGCRRFINAGSMEETILTRHLQAHWQGGTNPNVHTWYALAKLTARDAIAFETYKNKLDYLHTRISIAIDTQLGTDKYVERGIAQALNGQAYPAPVNLDLVNIASSTEIARQLIATALHGANQADYVLGTGEANTLAGYFQRCADYAKQAGHPLASSSVGSSSRLTPADFSIEPLIQHTGYRPTETFDTLLQGLRP